MNHGDSTAPSSSTLDTIARVRESVAAVVHVVDRDPSIHAIASECLTSRAVRVEHHLQPESLSSVHATSDPRCALVDLFAPQMHGLRLQENLAASDPHMTIVLMGAAPPVATVVTAMRNGALDVIEKPLKPALLSEIVANALAVSASRLRLVDKRQQAIAKLARLTPRQKAVVLHIIEGKPSSAIAADLMISPRTVDVHRFHAMQITGTHSILELIRLVAVAGGRPEVADIGHLRQILGIKSESADESVTDAPTGPEGRKNHPQINTDEHRYGS